MKNFLQNILCSFGFHDWSKWSTAEQWTYTWRRQFKTCSRCLKEKERVY